MDDFRRFFLRGLAALLPTLLTIALLLWAYRLVNDYFGVYITQGMLLVCQELSPRPAPQFVNAESDALNYGAPIDEWDSAGRRLTAEYKVITHPALTSSDPGIRQAAEKRRDKTLWKLTFAKYHFHFMGFLLAIVIVYFLGFFLASFIGRTSWRVIEGMIRRIPIIGGVYPNVKQVTDFLLSERQVEFSGVVAIQYPRKGTWSMGLRTGPPMAQVQRTVDRELVTIFIPSSPTPVTGYVVQVPFDEVIELNVTIDEAMRYAISAGVINLGTKLPAPRRVGDRQD